MKVHFEPIGRVLKRPKGIKIGIARYSSQFRIVYVIIIIAVALFGDGYPERQQEPTRWR